MNSKQKINHPLEQVFDMESGTVDISSEYSMIQQPQPIPAMVDNSEKDEEDKVIDGKIDAVYEAAMAAFNNQTAYVEIVEPRYAARNAEVAANYLNIALNAAATRARVKTDRKRAGAFIPINSGNKTTNNLIVADRNEILKMIQVDDKKEELLK